MFPVVTTPPTVVTVTTAFGGVATPLVSVPGTASNIPLTLNTSDTPRDNSLWSYALP